MAQSINLDDLLEGVVPYEPVLMRTPVPESSTLSEDQLFDATVKTAHDILRRSGVSKVEITQDDVADAHAMFMEHIEDPTVNKHAVRHHKPATIVKLEAIITEYDWRVIQHADQIRQLVTNKLIDLSDNKDARVQLKAVELLGKLADVGMFVDKQEVTYKQQSAAELQEQLQKKLGLLIQGEIVDSTIIHAPETEPSKKPEYGVTPLPEIPTIDLNAMLNGED